MSDIYAQPDFSKKARNKQEKKDDNARSKDHELRVYESAYHLEEPESSKESKEEGPQDETDPTDQKRSGRGVTLCLRVLTTVSLAAIVIAICYMVVNIMSLRDEVKQLKNKTEGFQMSLQKEMMGLGKRVERVEGTLCPNRWTSFEGSCYYKSNEGKNWLESRRDCQDRGADLVVINSKEEHEFVVEMSETGNVWIGLYPERSSGDQLYSLWKWVDGSPLTLQFWSEGRPTNNNWESHPSCCDSFNKWEQVYSNNNRKWICEK